MNITERNDDIVRLRKAGETMQFIADKHGLSRQRVAKVLEERGVARIPRPSKKPRPHDAIPYRERLAIRDYQITAAYAYGRTMKQIGKDYGLTGPSVMRIMKQQGRSASKHKEQRNRLICGYLKKGVSVKVLMEAYKLSQATISLIKKKGKVGTPASVFV